MNDTENIAEAVILEEKVKVDETVSELTPKELARPATRRTRQTNKENLLTEANAIVEENPTKAELIYS